MSHNPIFSPFTVKSPPCLQLRWNHCTIRRQLWLYNTKTNLVKANSRHREPIQNLNLLSFFFSTNLIPSDNKHHKCVWQHYGRWKYAGKKRHIWEREEREREEKRGSLSTYSALKKARSGVETCERLRGLKQRITANSSLPTAECWVVVFNIRAFI